MLNEFLYYLFPKRCIVCDSVIKTSELFCEDCKGAIKRIAVKTCPKCGALKKKCECNRFVYHFRGMAAPFLNENEAKQAIYNYKMLPNVHAADFFAPHMAVSFKEKFPEIKIDCVTSVPMKTFKKIATGYDHTAVLARKVAKQLNLPYVPLLSEVGKRKPQHELKAAERFKNVKGAYKAKKNNYTNVLLIDDIKTTGASLDECARQLMFAGTENVYALTAVISP